MKHSLLLVIFSLTQVTADYGLLNVQYGDKNTDFCVMYNPEFQEIPTTLEQIKYYPYVDLRPEILCGSAEHPELINQKLVTVSRGNCTFYNKAITVQNNVGEGIVVASKSLVVPSANESEYKDVHIPVAVITEKDADTIKALSDNVAAVLYAPEDTTRVDYNLILIWSMAVGTVVVGSYWAGLTAHKLDKKKLARLRRGLEDGKSEDDDDDDEEPIMDVSAVMILIFVVMIITMLLLLYFFYDYIVYVIIVLFCVAAAAGIHACLTPLVEKIPIGMYKIPSSKSSSKCLQVEVRSLLLALLSITFCALWFVYRHQDWAWIMQDMMGVAFSIHLLKTVRLPNFKICFILLSILFLYDIFFVFITPYFTKSGESVMVQVATGGGGAKEQIPIVLKVPRFSVSPYSVCDGLQYSLLGFGDILVPGLLVAYGCRFDFKVQSGKVYYIATAIAYGIGLVLCFIALLFMETGQPALLYLVPCTVGTMAVIGLRRRELKHLWNGHRGTANSAGGGAGGGSVNGEGQVEEHQSTNGTVQNPDDPVPSDTASNDSIPDEERRPLVHEK
ncbi:signal peptide peptidase-like 2A [Glandiceps talaboti]